MPLEKRYILMEKLLLQTDRAGGNDHLGLAKKRLPNHRDKVGETLANPRSRLNHQVPPPGGRVRDRRRIWSVRDHGRMLQPTEILMIVSLFQKVGVELRRQAGILFHGLSIGRV